MPFSSPDPLGSPEVSAYSVPDDVGLWKLRYSHAMNCVKPIIMAMGLYWHLQRDRAEMHEIMRKVGLSASIHERMSVSESLFLS